MTQQREPSYAELVYEVLIAAARPLTFPELFDAVNQRRPVTTRNPKATLRNALAQGPQLISLGDGRYGYLPHLLPGSLLRLPLTEQQPVDHPLLYPDEALQALWPSFFEVQKRRAARPVRARLRNDEEVVLARTLFGGGIWGSLMPEGLRRYLSDCRAGAGDALLIRVLDGEAGRCEAWYESRLQQDQAAVAQRNRELADVSYQFIAGSRPPDVLIWQLAVALLARGVYRADVAPDPLQAVLGADSRFVATGLQMWMLAEAVTPAMRATIRARERLERELRQATMVRDRSPSWLLPFWRSGAPRDR